MMTSGCGSFFFNNFLMPVLPDYLIGADYIYTFISYFGVYKTNFASFSILCFYYSSSFLLS